MKKQFETVRGFTDRIEQLDSTKKDYLVPSSEMVMLSNNEMIRIGSKDSYKGEFRLTDFAHGQLASRLGIPKSYYDSTYEIPMLRATNVNSWLHHKEENHFVRIQEENARAFLSDKYRPFDNILLMQAFLPLLVDEYPQAKIWASAISETRMYLQITFPQFEAEVKKGHVVSYGSIVTNSEVGRGAVDIKKFIGHYICTNGAIGESIMRQFHIGKRIVDGNTDIFRSDTIEAEINSLRLRMRDVMRNALSEDQFKIEVEKMKIANQQAVPLSKVAGVIEDVTTTYSLPKRYIPDMIDGIGATGDFNRYGIANSITALAHKLDNPDDQYQCEKVGQKLIDMTPKVWEDIIKRVA